MQFREYTTVCTPGCCVCWPLCRRLPVYPHVCLLCTYRMLGLAAIAGSPQLACLSVRGNLGDMLCTAWSFATQPGLYFVSLASRAARGSRQTLQCAHVLYSQRGHEGRSSILSASWITVHCTGTVARLLKDLKSLKEARHAHGLSR